MDVNVVASGVCLSQCLYASVWMWTLSSLVPACLDGCARRRLPDWCAHLLVTSAACLGDDRTYGIMDGATLHGISQLPGVAG